MNFKKGDLVTGYEFYPRLHLYLYLHFHLYFHLQLHLRPLLRPHPSDYGIILEAIDKKDAWMNFDEYTKDEKAQIQNCYIVHWQRTKEASLVYENEIKGV